MIRVDRLASLIPEGRRLVRFGVITSALQGLLGPLAVYSATHDISLTITAAMALIYAAALGLNTYLRRNNGARLAASIFRGIGALRTRLFDRVQGAMPYTVERQRRLHASDEFARMESMPIPVLDAIRFAVLIASTTLTILVLSGVSLVVWMIALGVSAWTVVTIYGQANVDRSELAEETRELDRTIGEFFSGFPQLCLDPVIGDALMARLRTRNSKVARRRTVVARLRAVAAIRLDATILLGAGVLLFVVPHHAIDLPQVDRAGLISCVMMMLLSVNYVRLLLHETHVLTTVDEAHGRVLGLMDALGERPPPSPVDSSGFESIGLRGASWRYTPDSPRLGPFDLTIRQGEIVFVVGGNGSGKTTLMKLFTGLYDPIVGSATLDGRRVLPANEQRRALFTTVFMEQHLFDRLYGIEADPDEVHRLLARFGLDGIVDVVDGRFTTTDLSTGQRKRLALIVGLLENRPLLVLDEWAAHQDPTLRKDYYEVLLPALRDEGRTVVAVSHDQRYFHLADRVITLGPAMTPDDRAPASG